MPGIPFPVICANPSCCELFFSTRAVGVPEGSQMQFEARGMGIGPCPKCGSMGRVPDGLYSLVDATIRDPREAERVRRFMAILERHVRFPTSLPQMMNELSSEGIPTSAWKPKNVTELVAWLGLIFTALQFMYSVYKDQRAESPPQRLSEETKQVIEMILDRSIPATSQQVLPSKSAKSAPGPPKPSSDSPK